MKKVFNIFSKIIIIFLIIILIYILYSKYIVKNKITKLGGYGFLIVLTGSMEPEISSGELVIIKEERGYNVGDIITYETGDLLVTHRIVEIRENADINNEREYICKGDFNNEKDLKIFENQIQGKVIYHSEALRKFC